MIDELEQRLAAIIGSDAAHLIRRMIDARELIGTAWEEDAPSPQGVEVRCPHCESWFEPVVTSPLSSTTRATPILT